MPNHMNQCCCGSLTCEQWFLCNLPPQITFPQMVFNRKQETRSSAGLLYEAEMVMTITNAVFTRDPEEPTPCYFLESATVSVTMNTKTWQIFNGLIDVSYAGSRCPDCLERCLITEETFTAVDYPIANCMSICCVSPCGPTADSLLRMTFDCIIEGDFEGCYHDAFEFGIGQCVTTCDKPYTTSMYFGFNAWTKNECPNVNWFKCRAVDFYTYDTQVPPYNGGFWASGRIAGTVGGNPLDNICSGEYEHERPLCIPIDTSFITDLKCVGANTPWGVQVDHYNVTSCQLNSQLQTGGIALCKNLECVDNSKTGANCCQRPVKCCSCTPICTDFICNGINCGQNYCCNTNGLLTYIERYDSLRSTWTQPTIP